ncbi:MAG: hypothetical protein GKR88_19520 [Flavobacteriaceae bacterium]|nr:MAG: hypothetical protein GKR88_19480 [Flavobacteriaceae bacterium]QMU66254.1 MAG: hypothetical protein GKR88_19520 [Flavobacteriaceae bacterium]
MKKTAITLLAFSSLIVITLLITSFQENMDNKTDYVPNEITAIKIAEAIWLPIYGNKILDKKPFVAKLENDDIWVVQGTSNTQKGDVPYIEIRKSDCKVLKVIHGK